MTPEQDRQARAAQLRAEADIDDLASAEAAERNPMYSEHLARRAQWKRRLANDEDGGIGQ